MKGSRKMIIKQAETDCVPSCHPDNNQTEKIPEKKEKVIRKRRKENANDKLKKWLARL